MIMIMHVHKKRWCVRPQRCTRRVNASMQLRLAHARLSMTCSWAGPDVIADGWAPGSNRAHVPCHATNLQWRAKSAAAVQCNSAGTTRQDKMTECLICPRSMLPVAWQASLSPRLSFAKGKWQQHWITRQAESAAAWWRHPGGSPCHRTLCSKPRSQQHECTSRRATE